MSEIEHLWPDIRKSLFEMEGDAADSNTKCFIKHIDMAGFDFGDISSQYKTAADALVAHIFSGGLSKKPEFVFFPIIYLYRHSLELKLKSLITVISESGAIAKPDITSEHGLVRLWQIVKPELIKRWPKADKKPLNNVEALLTDFHKIDKTGQSLRYHETKEGKASLDSLPEHIRLEYLSEAFGEIYSLLDGCESGFVPNSA